MVVTALVVLVGFATFAYGSAPGQAAPVSRVPTAERLWTGQLWAGILASDADAAERKVIEQLCGRLPESRGDRWTQWVSCSLQRRKLRADPIATIYVEASERSEIAALVHEGWDRDVNGEVARAWFVEARKRPGVFHLWSESSFAYDYGMHIAGIQVAGEWARLLTAAPVDGWLRLSPNSREGARYYFHVDQIARQIVDLADVVATDPEGRTQTVKRGAYLVLGVENDVVTFRAEVPSDFSCGDPVVDPAPFPRSCGPRVTPFSTVLVSPVSRRRTQRAADRRPC